MNSKLLHFLKNFSYTFTSNIISLAVSTMVILIVPKLIGVDEYGYWQLFLFYSSYVGFLHFGWIDGIYLRYGGYVYGNLNRNVFLSQFFILLLFQLLISIIIFTLSTFIIHDDNRIFIFQMIALYLFLTNIRHYFLMILQATNRIKVFAKITIVDRVLYLFIILVLVLLGNNQYELMIYADLIGKLISLFYAIYSCKEIILSKFINFKFVFREILSNTNSGIKLMFANISSMLIMGANRFGIEKTWNVEIFGKVSLIFSISNLMMIFINALGIILFPLLRRMNITKVTNFYEVIRNLLSVTLLSLLILYFPLEVFLSAWLPKYADSLKYLTFLFPIFIYEGKMALVVNTYLKTLRREKVMLQVNLISLFFSVLCTYLTTQYFESLDLTMLSIVIILAFRSILAEFYLGKLLKINEKKNILLELIISSIFITSCWFLNSWYSFLIYLSVYIIYLLIQRKGIFQSITKLRLIIEE